MSKSQKLAKVFFVFAIILSLIFSIKYNVYATNSVYESTTIAQKGDAIYFEKPADWGNYIPYIYAWDNNVPPAELNDGWPGTPMTLVKGNLYKYEFQDNTPYKKIVFSNGLNDDNKIKTQDLDYICNGFIYNEETISQVSNIAYSIKTLYSGDTIYFKRPDSWNETVYIYMWNSFTNANNADWNSKPAMTYDVTNDIYSYTLSDDVQNVSGGFDMVIFATADGKQTIDLAIVGNNLTFIADQNAESDVQYNGDWMYDRDKSLLSTLATNTTLPIGDESYYTEDSYKIYKEQFDIAKTLLNSKYVTASFTDHTSQYDKSLLALQFAYDNLRLNTTILSDKINEMKNVDTSKYEQSLVNAFNASIQNAETLLDDVDTLTVTKMKSAINNIDIAYNNLVVDKSELEILINKAKNIDTTLYTDESAKNLVEALKNANIIFEDSNASYTDVQNEIIGLNNAISNLILKEETNTNEDKNLDNVEENKQEEVIQNSSNPYTGDVIFLLAGVLVLAIAIFTITTLYLKKQKNK